MKFKPSKKKTFSRSFSIARVQDYKTPLAVLGLAVAIFVVSLIWQDSTRQAKQAITEFTAPVVDAAGAPFRAMSNAFDSVTDLTHLRSENARLAAENTRLLEWYERAQLLESENLRLKEIASYGEALRYEYVTARIMADTGTAFHKSYIAALPEGHVVQKGQAVMKDGYMIGRVVEVGDDIARILLVTDFNARIPVIVEGTDIRAIMAGDNDALPRLIHMPIETEIEEGAALVTSGHGGILPPGLKIGTVTRGSEYKVNLGVHPDQAHMVQIVLYSGMDASALEE